MQETIKENQKSYFESLNTKKITDNRTFWKTVVPLFTNKASRGEKIILTEAEKHISDDEKICNIFNNFFSKVVSDLKKPDYYKYFSQENTCSLSTIIETFEKHPSILNVKKRKLVSVFSFRKTTQKEVLKVIQDLNAKKSCQTSDTPTKIIKLNCDIFSNLIYKHFNCCIDKGEFPNDLKHADIVPIYKKNKCKKENYRPVSVLSNLSKIYEKLMYNQLYEYFDNILFPSQCGFRKGYSAQHCLLVMIEKFKEAIDRGYEFGALLTDLSKAFDCINHPLLIAKLYNYGVSPLSINLIFSYLNNRTHRTKINNCFSERSIIEHGVPQGSILGPLLFNIDLIDLFYECEESNIASYADDTTPYSCARDTQTVISELKSISSKLFHWFQYNHLKANPGKCHLLLSSKTPTDVSIGDASIKTSTKETLLGILIDSELSFDQHISSICSKASKKLHALGRIASFMSFNKRRTLMKAFIESQFNYCPLIWMFHSRTMNNKINRIHERALRLVYSDHVSSFDELLKKDRSVSIHHRNIQSLAIELYKFLHGLSPSIMKNVFHFNTNIPYNLRSRSELYSRNPKTVKYRTKTISYLAPKIWSLVPNAIKNSKSLDVFKFKIHAKHSCSIFTVIVRGNLFMQCSFYFLAEFLTFFFWNDVRYCHKVLHGVLSPLELHVQTILFKCLTKDNNWSL